jgi:hypothetical protein
MLQAARNSLLQLRFVDQANVSSKIGAVQGASLQQSALGLSVSGFPIAGVSTTANAPKANSTTSAGLTGSSSQSSNSSGGQNNGSTGTGGKQAITQPGFTPTAATLPQAGNAFTLPSTFSPSAVDTLNEEMQLTYEVANLSLLLEGSLTDRFVKGNKILQRRTTVGFPISIAVPPGKKYRNAVAEIEVKVSANNPLTPLEDAPGLVAILPREKTYNVAKITDKSFEISGGVATQVVSVGANWLRGSKTFFLVQDQDTLAFQLPPQAPSHQTIFGWQFRPVLGESIVKNGLRQTFAQLAFPVDRRSGCLGMIQVTTRWRHYDAKHGAVGGVIKGSEINQDLESVDNFDLSPTPPVITWNDSGGGLITTTLTGSFLPGTHVRVGNSILDIGTPGFIYTDSGIQFTAPAALIASSPAFIVSRDGSETELLDASFAPVVTPLRPCGQAKLPIPASQPANNPAAAQVRMGVRVNDVKVRSFDEANAELVLTAETDPTVDTSKLLILVGNRLFGLSDTPPINRTEWNQTTNKKTIELRLVVPVTLLRTARSIKVKRLFAGSDYEDIFALNIRATKPGDLDIDFVPARVAVTFQDKNRAQLAITGSDLDGATVVVPDVATSLQHLSSTVLLFSITPDQLKGLKQVILRNPQGQIVLLPVADSTKSSQPNSQPGESPPEKPKLDTHAPIKAGKGIKLVVKGTSLDSIQNVSLDGKFLNEKLSDDKSSIEITLPDAVGASPGEKTLHFILKDGTVLKYPFVIVP